MRSGHFIIAARVISLTDAEHPADAVLRDVLRAERGLHRSEGRDISRAVFAYYRWRGWLDANDPMPRQLQQAMDLAERFVAQPESFNGAELQNAAPEWIGGKMPVSTEWLRAIQQEPALWLRARKGQGTELAGKLSAVPHPALPDALRYDGEEDLFRSHEFQAGEFQMQDIASQAVGHVCNPQPGETWWDACAGEGGKLLHLSSLMENRGLIWASDRAEWRLKKLKQRAARAKCFNYRAAFWDGGAKLPTKTRFDGVLVDAPCSGVGTWARNPHARWTTTPETVDELAAVQTKLLGHVATLIKPGGRLVYSVCTLTTQETEGVVAAFQQSHPEFTPLASPNPLAPTSAPSAAHFLWPQDTGGSGMFIAAWQRTG